MVTAYSAGFAFIIAIFSFLSIMLVQATPTCLDPIVAGFFVGALVKNIPLGLAIGATLELMSLGLWNYGGAIVPDYFVGAVLGTAFAALTKQPQAQAIASGIAIAVPVAVFISQLDIFFWSVSTFFIHKADTYAENHNDRGVSRMHLLGLMPWYITRSLVMFFAIWLGATPIQHLIASIPAWLTNGLTTMAAILPALGFGILLTYLPIEKWWSFFIIGFVLFAYLKVPLLGVALVALAIVIIYASLAQQGKDTAESSDVSEIGAGMSKDETSNVTHADLVKAMWRHNFTLEFSWNWERMQALGFCWSIMPVLRKAYPKDDDYYAAIKRHLAFYNCNPSIGSPTIFGAVCAMEEHHQSEMAESLKVSLMGPFAGIGDTFDAVLVKPLLAVFAAALALQGNAASVWIMLVGWIGLVWFFLKFPGFWLGYHQGLHLLKQVSSGVIAKLTEYVGMAALVVMGAFVPSILSGVSTKVEFTKTVLMEGKKIAQTVKLQDTFDKILPYAIPLVLTFFVYYLLKKKHWTNVRVLLVMIVIGIVLGAFRIL